MQHLSEKENQKEEQGDGGLVFHLIASQDCSFG